MRTEEERLCDFGRGVCSGDYWMDGNGTVMCETHMHVATQLKGPWTKLNPQPERK